MSERAHDLIDDHDVDPELIEALLWRYGADVETPDPESLDGARERVYEFIRENGPSLRTAADHFYRFEDHPDYGSRPDAPATEPDFEIALDRLVEAGLIARTDDDLPRYSASFHDVLVDAGPSFTADEIDALCEDTGMDKRAVYHCVLGSLELDLDLGR
ncbi:hypothetical protein [Halobellus limi]|uniref:Uncharacterized protein n=1 Tax=Halobellus limi TaxID=699433 RepID=A0A1H6B944_9EURY|nr:hypothetical protein [Halobellus limi]QCC49178.1 hypothetical protein DV707_15605 [Halobellus limi]SEG56676.1 hypothetical protein SAMN04488133_2647 [Halobellus limi]